VTHLGDRIFSGIRRRPMVTVAAVAVLVISIVLLSGCAQQRIGVELYDPNVYQRSEVDAINAEMQCKQTARTQLEMARCIVSRRGP
jgi:cell division protein FtsX